MFEIGFSELVLVMIIGLLVLGPERLPVAVKTVASWIKALRSLASSVQNELTQELKLQELQESLKKVEKASIQNLSPELKASMDELRSAAEAMKQTYQQDDSQLTPITTVDQPSTPIDKSSTTTDQSSSEPSLHSSDSVTTDIMNNDVDSSEKLTNSGNDR